MGLFCGPFLEMPFDSWFNSAAFAYALSGKLCRVRFNGHKTQSWVMSRPLTLMRKAISMDPRGREVVWPGKCYCIGVKVASIVEMLSESPPVTSKASPAQVSDQSPPTFKESLLAASAYQAGPYTEHRQKPVSEDPKLPPTMPYIRFAVSPSRSQELVQQRVLVTQQPQLIYPALIAMQLPTGSAVAAGQPKRDGVALKSWSIESNISQPAGAKPDSVPPSHVQKEDDPPQAASILPLATLVSQPAASLSNTVANVLSNTLSSTLPHTASNAVPNANDSVVANAIPGVLPDVVQKTVSGPVSSAAPNAIPSIVSNAIQKPLPGVLPGVVSSTLAQAVPGAIPSRVTTALPSASPSFGQNSASPFVPKAIPDASSNAASIPHCAVNSTALGDVAPKSNSVSISQAHPPAATPNPSGSATGLTALGDVAPKSNSVSTSQANPLTATPDPGGSLTGPSARGDVAPKSNSGSTSQANPPAATPDPGGSATGLSVPGATADQLVALIQPNGGLLVPAQASTSGASPAAVAQPSVTAVANGKDGASAINNATGLKQHAPASSDQTGSQTGSQGTAPFGDQSQGGAAQQGQSAAPAQVNFANHTVTVLDHAQAAGLAAPPQTAPTLAGVTAHTAKTPDIAASATVPLPQAVPVINTAKLIQSMGQSEMRVGMRSDDFGNISISTSATRDLISAQISLDHGELARTLATHLPEMQARLGGNQAMDVRIDMNGQAAGQGTGTAPGMSNGSADGSRGDRQQKGSETSSQSADGFAGQGSAIAAAGLLPGEGGARLDIRA